MSEINYDNLFQTCVLLLQYKSEKTLSPKVINCAFKILFLSNTNYTNAIKNANKYVSIFTNDELKLNEFKNGSKLKRLLVKYLDTDAQEIYQCDFRVNSTSYVYLCALNDTFDGSFKTQLNSLTKKNKKEIIEKDEEYFPENLIENNEELEIVPMKTRSKSISKSSNI